MLHLDIYWKGGNCQKSVVSDNEAKTQQLALANDLTVLMVNVYRPKIQRRTQNDQTPFSTSSNRDHARNNRLRSHSIIEWKASSTTASTTSTDCYRLQQELSTPGVQQEEKEAEEA